MLFILVQFCCIRAALPRYRWDQLMILAWRAFLPVIIPGCFVLYTIVDFLNNDLVLSAPFSALALRTLLIKVISETLVSNLIKNAPKTYEFEEQELFFHKVKQEFCKENDTLLFPKHLEQRFVENIEKKNPLEAIYNIWLLCDFLKEKYVNNTNFNIPKKYLRPLS